MTPAEKIEYVKKQIRETAQISPEGSIHLRLYTLTEYEDGPTLVSFGEQNAILRKLESEGYIKNLKIDEDKHGAWLELAPPPKPRIKLKVLELISKKLADVFTTHEIVSTLVDFGIHREDIPSSCLLPD